MGVGEAAGWADLLLAFMAGFQGVIVAGEDGELAVIKLSSV